MDSLKPGQVNIFFHQAGATAALGMFGQVNVEPESMRFHAAASTKWPMGSAGHVPSYNLKQHANQLTVPTVLLGPAAVEVLLFSRQLYIKR